MGKAYFKRRLIIDVIKRGTMTPDRSLRICGNYLDFLIQYRIRSNELLSVYITLISM